MPGTPKAKPLIISHEERIGNLGLDWDPRNGSSEYLPWVYSVKSKPAHIKHLDDKQVTQINIFLQKSLRNVLSLENSKGFAELGLNPQKLLMPLTSEFKEEALRINTQQDKDIAALLAMGISERDLQQAASDYHQVIGDIYKNQQKIVGTMIEKGNVDLRGLSLFNMDMDFKGKEMKPQFDYYRFDSDRTRLSGGKMTNVNFIEPNFSRIYLQNITITGSMKKPNFSDASFSTNTSLKGMKLTEGNFQKMMAWGVNFSDTEMPKGNFTDTSISNGNFTNAKMQESNFSQARVFGGSNFSNATLSGSNFSESQVKNTRFENANLQNASFTYVRMGDDFTTGGPKVETWNDLRVSFKGADLAGADFSGAILGNVDFRGAKNVGKIKVSPSTKWHNVLLTDEQIDDIAANPNNKDLGTDWAKNMKQQVRTTEKALKDAEDKRNAPPPPMPLAPGAVNPPAILAAVPTMQERFSPEKEKKLRDALASASTMPSSDSDYKITIPSKPPSKDIVHS